MNPDTEVESFELDHTRVRAPYVRRAGEYRGPRGDRVTKFDLRLVQPNEAEIPTAALHTIEHLFAGYLRDALEANRDLPEASAGATGERAPLTVVDASPMGCRTGFYLTLLGDPAEERVRDALRFALEGVTRHRGDIPGCSPERCGNYRDHSLPGAQAWAARVLRDDIIVQPTVPLP